MLFDTRQIARGWLAVALASSTDKGRPALNRTVHIEQHARGVRLAATDSYMLLYAWVPGIDHELDQSPDLDETPISTATAMDLHGRAKGFLAHVLKLATAEGAEPIDIRLHLNVAGGTGDLDEFRGQSQFEGMEARSVVVEQPDVERVVLESYEGDFPDWRKVLAGHTAESTRLVALNPEIVGRLAKIGGIHPNARLGWVFGGAERAARLDVLDSEPHVQGVVMPCRWDFDRNAPMVEAEPAAEDDDEDEAPIGADETELVDA